MLIILYSKLDGCMAVVRMKKNCNYFYKKTPPSEYSQGGDITME